MAYGLLAQSLPERLNGVPQDLPERLNGVPQDSAGGSTEPRLAPTVHPALPAHPTQYWFVEGSGVEPIRLATLAQGKPPAVTGSAKDIPGTPAGRLARAAKLIADEEFSEALPLVNPAEFSASPLEGYARYYRGLALEGLSRLDEADRLLTALVASEPVGYLREAAPMALADVALARGDGERAENILEDLGDDKLRAPQAVLMQLAAAEESVGHVPHALDAYRRVYYDFPLTEQAVDAKESISRLETPALVPADRRERELARAEALFVGRQWAAARAAFQPLAAAAKGDEREVIALRLAEADYYLDRHRAARTALVPYLNGARREAEARYFHLTATRALGDHGSYVTLARGLVADHPDSDWAAETLNSLASHYITIDEDEKADPIFREVMRRFPRHRHSERAAWKTGWNAYRDGRFEEAARIFESAAATFPRADNRPAWLYWSGRSRDRLGDKARAAERYRLVVSDYQNLYYGRLAAAILKGRGEPLLPAGARQVGSSSSGPPPNEPLIRALTAAGMYEQALDEVQYSQIVWGDSPQLLATSAWIRHQQGRQLESMERFTALRGAITTMRRAYPQFMAAGGENLPADVLRIIYPLDYWPLITKYAKAHDLDPYLLAALMAQESTFTADIRSAANAYGLMQLIPGTGRQVARQLGIRPFRTSMLTQPETNVRLGTKYFKDMVDQFGGVHYALAGYNAGPHRVVEWLKEAQGLSQDEFIDNIPFQETQTYVKRILGTAEDYRRLYGSGLP
jgi:soluble lytic murein transglycosylase